MNGPGSVTQILGGLVDGDDAAAQQIWEGYFRRMVGLARQKLGGMPRGPADSEDIAISAFHSFCQGAEKGRFPRLNDRNDLWQVMVLITARKAIDSIRKERAAKRGGGAVHITPGSGEENDAPYLDEVVGKEPTPSFAAEVAEQYRVLIESLGDPDLKKIANWKLEGYTHTEIAEKMGRAVATVERKVKLIRETWEARGGQ